MNNEKVYLNHILERCIKIRRLMQGVSKNQFFADENLQDIVIRSLEIIGEATTHVSAELKDKYDEVSWIDLKNFRNIMIHQYFRIDLNLVYDVVQNDIPELQSQIQTILEEEK